MSSWFKVDTAILQNDRIMDAGPQGALIFIQLLALNAHGGEDGQVSAGKHKPRYLASLLAGLYHGSQDEVTAIVRDGLANCIGAGLVEIDPKGVLHISGFDAEWKPPLTSAERARRHRERKRLNAGVTDQRDATPSDDDSTETVTENPPKKTPKRASKPKGVTKPERANVTLKSTGKTAPSQKVTLDRQIDRQIDREEERPPSKGSSSSDRIAAGSEAAPPEEGCASTSTVTGQRDAQPERAKADTLHRREQGLSNNAAQMLNQIRAYGVLARKQHRQVDLVKALDAEQWTKQTLAWTIERTQQRVKSGSWQPTLVALLHDQAERERTRKLWRMLAKKASTLEHCFGTDIDAQIKTQAPCLADQYGITEAVAYERIVAQRYADLISFREHDQEGALWSLEGVPSPFRQHLSSDGSTLKKVEERASPQASGGSVE